MKNFSFLLVLILLACSSCSSRNGSVSDKQKENIKKEIKEVANSILSGFENLNADDVLKSWHNTPEFLAISNVTGFSYKEVSDLMRSIYPSFTGMKYTPISENFYIVDDATVIYTTKCKFQQDYKDGRSEMNDPMLMQFVFRKIDGKWMAINAVETFQSQPQPVSASLSGNQQELMKKFVGTWKAQVGKDTVHFWTCGKFNNSYESYMKGEAKGKLFYERKVLMGYDEMKGKIIVSVLDSNNPSNTIFAGWFPTPDVFQEVLIDDMSNPSAAKYSWKFEFKNDRLVWNTLQDNKVVDTFTYTKLR